MLMLARKSSPEPVRLDKRCWRGLIQLTERPRVAEADLEGGERRDQSTAREQGRHTA